MLPDFPGTVDFSVLPCACVGLFLCEHERFWKNEKDNFSSLNQVTSSHFGVIIMPHGQNINIYFATFNMILK